MNSDINISNSVAIPVNINVGQKASNPISKEIEDLMLSKHSSLKTIIGNVEQISPSIISSVVISEEELTGDLPSEYGETRIVIQARDPHWAWVYWEYSSIERKKLEDELGTFEYAHTELFLKVFNKTMGYSFEVKLPENCDNWYLSLNDSNCEYYVQLCVHIPSEGDKVLATSEVVLLPTDKVSENLAKWVPGKPVDEENKISSENNNLDENKLVETIEKIDSFTLPEENAISKKISSSDEVYKKESRGER